MKIQSFYGLIPHLKAKGSLSMNVLEMIMRMRRQVGQEALSSVPEIDTLILIDRKVDLISPLVNIYTLLRLI